MPLITFETIGHHTFENRRGDDIINAPYKCDDTKAFLGRGYYFWEDNLPFAKHWGGRWYHEKGKKYFVGEALIECDHAEFFDLIGSRSDQNFLREAAKLIAQKNSKLSAWPIGRIIEVLKAANLDPDGVFYQKFNFKVLRAADNASTQLAKPVKFTVGLPNYTDLYPCYIICVTFIKGIISTPLKLVHSSN